MAKEREAMQLHSEKEAQKAVEQARLAAYQAKKAAEQARRMRMELEQLLAASQQGQPLPEPQPETEYLSLRLNSQSEPPQTYTNSIDVEFVLIPAGTFLMGSRYDDSVAAYDEKPQREVTISRPFLLGKYPVTQAQWEAVMGNNPSSFTGSKRPVEMVSWDDAQKFIRKLNAKESSNHYRLPTEAEWEYACRAGTTGRYCFGDDKLMLGGYAWFSSNSQDQTHPVGRKKANAWGLYDMYGNVEEWCLDWFDANYYREGATVDPQGPTAGLFRVHRGGCWFGYAEDCRSATRKSFMPDNSYVNIGFRLALDVE